MSIINEQNTKEHSYPVYGRQFKSYRWYKPIIVGVLFVVVYLFLSLVLTVGVTFYVGKGLTPDALMPVLKDLVATNYDSIVLDVLQ